MVLGVVGRGYWGDVYCKTLLKMGIPHWQMGRDWSLAADGIIVASSPESHYEVARKALEAGLPVLMEKPVCTSARDVEALLELPGKVFCGYTRLYSPAWRKFWFPASHVEAWYGGGKDPWDAASHLVAMSLDLGCEPVLHLTKEKQPLRLIADGKTFVDVETDPTPLEVLIGEFVTSEPTYGLEFALKVTQYLERHVPR